MINDIKDLQKLFKLCRAQGVTDIEVAGVKIKFGDMPQTSEMVNGQDISYEDQKSKYANFPQGELTPEQLLFYSSGGVPEEDPYLKEAVS